MLELMTSWTMQQWSVPNRAAPEWLRCLRRYAAELRHRIKNWGPDSQFKTPDVWAVLKGVEGTTSSYRAITQFGVDDALIGSMVARYFRLRLDSSFDVGSLAFRAPAQGAPPTHHDAITKILNFAKEARGEDATSPLWVTEVDIRGFFDSVSHSVVPECLRDASTAPDEVSLDPRAVDVLYSYLRMYSFNKFGRESALKAARRLARTNDVAVPWPDAALAALGVAIQSDDIGVPQGGALSCFIANLVLHRADRAVRSSGVPFADYIYLRYCDDIIIVSRTRESCLALLESYLSALRGLKLPYHNPVGFDDSVYRVDAKQFWKSKSKLPFAWSSASDPGHVPWCSFVGYQLRHDLTMRVRRTSLRKAMDKHVSICGDIARRVLAARKRFKATLPDKQILYRARQKLRSTAVDTSLLHLGARPSAICWAGGFRLIKENRNPVLFHQLRTLDRHKASRLRRLRRALEAFPDKRKGLKALTDDRAAKFEGRPYSYFAISDSPTDDL